MNNPCRSFLSELSIKEQAKFQKYHIQSHFTFTRISYCSDSINQNFAVHFSPRQVFPALLYPVALDEFASPLYLSAPLSRSPCPVGSQRVEPLMTPTVPRRALGELRRAPVSHGEPRRATASHRRVGGDHIYRLAERGHKAFSILHRALRTAVNWAQIGRHRPSSVQ